MIFIKKAFRSLISNKSAYLSCIFLITISVFMITSLGGASRALKNGALSYYENNRLADVFAKVKNISSYNLSYLEKIEGIKEVQARLVYDARALITDSEKIIYMRIISHDKEYTGIQLNSFIATENELTSKNDILVGNRFLKLHSLTYKDKIKLIIEGKEVDFNIASGVISPEYVYAVKESGSLYPDPEAFDIAFVDINDLNVLLGKQNEYNDLTFELEEGYKFDDVKDELIDVLTPFGLLSLVEQKNQTSVKMLDVEITQITSMSNTIPILFASMASIVLYLMLKRVIEQERTQIGTLKAFGFSNFKIITHYLLYGITISFIGGVLGIVLGGFSIKPLIDSYSSLYTIPNIKTTMPIDLAIIGFVLALLFGIIGSFAGSYGVLSLEPVEAMKASAPEAVKFNIMSKMKIINMIFTSKGNMAIRNIIRSKFRSLFIIVGIMFSFGMLATIASINDMVDVMVINRYTKSLTYDCRIYLKNAVDKKIAVQEARKLEGVYISEVIHDVSAEIRSKNIKENASILGIEENSKLVFLYDDEDKYNKKTSTDCIVLNKIIAEKLNVEKNDYVYIKTIYNTDEIKLIVSDVVNQNMSINCYMDIDSLNSSLKLPEIGNSLVVKTTDIKEIIDFSNGAKNIDSIEDTQNTVVIFKNMMKNFNSLIMMLFVVSFAISFAIIYNSSSISLSEKKREFATLMVLGMQVNEVSGILSFEYWVLFIFGCSLGIPFTSLMKSFMYSAINAQIDNFRLPTSTSYTAFLIAFFGCMGAVMFSNLSAKQNIRKFDKIDVLKERE